MFLEVIDVDYIKDYQLFLVFNNNDKKIVDLKNHLKGEIFKPLTELSFFRQYGLINSTIEWSNGADFAPEFLYEIGTQIK